MSALKLSAGRTGFRRVLAAGGPRVRGGERVAAAHARQAGRYGPQPPFTV